MQSDRRALGGLAALCGGIAAIRSARAQGAAETDLQRIVRTKKVRVGAVEAAPWYIRDLKTDKWTGVVPEQVELLFGTIGVEVEYVPTQWGTAVAGLQSDKFDVMGAYVANPQRALAVDFTSSTYDGLNGLVTLKPLAADVTWASLNVPETKVAGVTGAGSTVAIQRLIPKASWTLVQSNDAMMLELDSGRVEMIATNEATMLDYIAKRRRGTAVYPTPKIITGANFAVRKTPDRDLLNWLNTSLEYFRQTGMLETINEKYLALKR
jgi:polar amino acid transport system substrate-binding protein